MVNKHWPTPLSADAFWGVGGEIIKTLLPHTEADEAALLSQLLVAFGNVIGRSPHFTAEADRHGTNLFIANIGNTSKGRKGTSWGHIERLFKIADEDWTTNNIRTGLSSGEGLLFTIQDKNSLDPMALSESDKRILCMESEFASILKLAKKEGNILSPVLRNAWDGKTLQSLTKHSPMKVTDPHISLIAHITKTELVSLLSATEISNGLGNRFLFFCVQRSKSLPDGGNLEKSSISYLADIIKDAIDFGKQSVEMKRNSGAKILWHQIYDQLSQGRSGLAGSLLGRSEAQVMRLALIQSVMNKKTEIVPEALHSAIEIHRYCTDSIYYIYGNQTGSPLADKIYDFLEDSPEGLRKIDITNKLSRNQSQESISHALQILLDAQLAFMEELPTNGRPAQIWKLTKYKKLNELNEQRHITSFNSYLVGDKHQ